MKNRCISRRKLLAAGLSVPGAVALRGVLSQAAPPKTRAAVVIGVDKPTHVQPLKAAASGAVQMARWLHGEGFDVTLLDDRKHAVKVSAVLQAVFDYVNRPTLEQLVIYFAGHGHIAQNSEYWLLSGAPADPNEAVCMDVSIWFAKRAAIPNIVFISDACRSTAASLNAEEVRGLVIFPNPDTAPNAVPDVDVLYATRIGSPAWEHSVDKTAPAYEAVFTTALLEAYKNPDASMVKPVDGKLVVPNRLLKPYLDREVPKRARAASIQIEQLPDVEIVSEETTYIGTVHRSGPFLAPGAPPAPSLSQLAEVALRGADQQTGARGPNPGGWLPLGLNSTDPLVGPLQNLAASSGFSDSVNRILYTPRAPLDTGVQSGFQIPGVRVVKVITLPRAPATVTDDPDLRGSVVRVELAPRSATTVALRFEDGRGCMLAALRGYIAIITLGDQGVINVSYSPARDNPVYTDYVREGARLSELHAVVATAARFGAFRIEGGRRNTQEALRIGDRIRVLKFIDATLGLYAAYAYAEASLTNSVRSVNANIREEYNTALWDIAALAGDLAGRPTPAPSERLVPLCPMLSQGWNQLRVWNIQLPGPLGAARDHLLPSFWTTFSAPGMDLIEGFLTQATQA